MLIYRIENENGEGPYRYNDGNGDELFDHCGRSDTRPGPALDDFFFPEEGILDCMNNDNHWNILQRYMSEDTFFAFSDKTQLRNWFNRKERRILRNHGFAVVTYDVPEDGDRISSHQVMFKKPLAQKVQVHSFGVLGGI